MMYDMVANFVRLTVVANDNQLDVSLPAQRPIVEYIDDVLDLLGPASAPVGTAWTLSTPSAGPMDLEDTLADHRVLDGARLHLAKSAEAAAPPFVDDVLAEAQRSVDGRFGAWAGEQRQIALAVAVSVVLVLSSVLIAPDDGRWQVAGTLAALAAATVAAGLLCRANRFGHILWSATVPAGLAVWRATATRGRGEELMFSLAAVAVVVGAGSAGVLRKSAPALAAATTSVVCLGLGGAFAAGANPLAASVWSLPVLVVAVLFAPRLAMSSSGLLAQIRLSERMELAERAAIAKSLSRGRMTVDVLVWVPSILSVPAVATIALAGVWEQGLAAGLFVVIWLLRSRNFAHTRHVAPMVVSAAVGTAFLVVGAVGWTGVSATDSPFAAGAAAAVVCIAFGVGALPSLDEVPAARVRRLLDAFDLPLVLALLPLVFFGQGVYSLVWPT